jgi:hypothetical protein
LFRVKIFSDDNFDGLVKIRQELFFVMPAKAGIQGYQLVTTLLDYGFHHRPAPNGFGPDRLCRSPVKVGPASFGGSFRVSKADRADRGVTTFYKFIILKD